MTDIKKAFVTAVPFGSLTIEGLMDENKNFYVSVPQVADMAGIDNVQGNAARGIKRILRERYNPVQLSVVGTTHNRVNALTLREFETVLRELDRRGNESVRYLVDALVGLSLTQLFSDAFNIKLTADERERYLKQREVHRVNFRPKYTDHLKNDGCKNYGKEVNRLKLSAGVPLEPLDTYKDDELNALNEKEVEYNLLRKLGYSHNKALRTI